MITHIVVISICLVGVGKPLYTFDELKIMIYGGADYVTELISRLGSAAAGKAYLCDRFVCPIGERLKINPSAPEPVPNGCGSYNVTLPRFLIPLSSSCCDQHDACYSTCGRRRSVCDGIFERCMANLCQMVDEDRSTFRQIDPDACRRLAKSFKVLVENFGCLAFLQAQKMYCYCKGDL